MLEPKSEELFKINQLSDDISRLYLNPLHADINFVIGEEIIPAHKALISARCSYLNDLLQTEDSNVIDLDVDAEAFKVVLKYLYTGTLERLNVKTIFKIIQLDKRFRLCSIQDYLEAQLGSLIDVNNAFDILNWAILNEKSHLRNICEDFFDQNAETMLKQDSMANISQDVFISMLKRDSFFADELSIFKAVAKWSENNYEKAKEVIKYVRLNLIHPDDLVNIVKPTKLVDDVSSNESKKILRAKILYDVNLASAEMGAKVLEAQNPQYLLNRSIENYDIYTEFTSCNTIIRDGGISRIIVELKEVSVINHIRMLLNVVNIGLYGYYIEVSKDNENWEEVIDYSKFLCQSWQDLYFQRQKVKYIKIVGTLTQYVSPELKILALEAYLKKDVPQFNPRGIIYPQENIATHNKNAVIRTPQNMNPACLMGKFDYYGFNFGFTSMKLNKELIIRFAQPYLVSSLRFLLLDCGKRTYSYRVYIRLTYRYWLLIGDKSDEECKSWQTFEFDRAAVTGIKLIGTASNRSNTLDVVYIECPNLNKVGNNEVADKSNGKEIIENASF